MTATTRKYLDWFWLMIINFMFCIGVLAVLVLKESITPLMMAGGGIVAVSTIVVTVYESEILAWLGWRPGSSSV